MPGLGERRHSRLVEGGQTCPNRTDVSNILPEVLMRIIAFLGILLAFSPDAVRAAIIANGDNQPTQITGLTIAGEAYDVTFSYGTHFNTVWPSLPNPDPEPTFWGNSSGAKVAVQSIAAYLDNAGVSPEITTYLIVPWGIQSNGNYVDSWMTATVAGGNYTD